MGRSGRTVRAAVMLLLGVGCVLAGCGTGGTRASAPTGVEMRLPPLPVRTVGRNQLKPRVAVMRVENRTALEDTLVDGLFFQRMTEALQAESGNARLVLPQDADFPAGLGGFTRDDFGRLDAFGLATFARQENLNAVVSAMVLDASVRNEVGGLLLWKRPEGRLRLMLLVEVFASASGTKLMSRPFTFDTEVTGIPPDADQGLRDSDLALVRSALGELAEEVGETVGDTLSELPWQGFVTNLSGDRITLSSDAGSGLEPGNLLDLTDSRIVDGLDGHKYFMPSEAIGRMQVTDVADRVQGVLLWGEGIGIYTLAAP